MEQPISLIVHGGAGRAPSTTAGRRTNEKGCRAAVQLGFQVLTQGGSAVEAVEATIVDMEDNPLFNAGYGGYPDERGVVNLDAGIMQGSTLAAGGVVALEHTRNPIQVAAILLRQRGEILLEGQGAREFATAQGIPWIENEELLVEREYPKLPIEGGSTVGCVALDAEGDIAAGASTGGLWRKMHGRVGDSAILGAGYYANNQWGGASATGDGQAILRATMSRRIMDFLLARHSPMKAAELAVEALEDSRIQGSGGIIALNMRGQIGFAHNTAYMVGAYIQRGGEIHLLS